MTLISNKSEVTALLDLDAYLVTTTILFVFSLLFFFFFCIQHVVIKVILGTKTITRFRSSLKEFVDYASDDVSLFIIS